MAQFSFKFIEKRNLWFSISITFIVFGFFLMAVRAFQSKPILNYGIDFSGGTTVLCRFEALDQQYLKAQSSGQNLRDINLQFMQSVREVLAKFGLEQSSIQITSDKEVMIKTNQMDNSQSMQLIDQMKERFGGVEILEIDYIGPVIGAEMRERALWIVCVVTFALMLYITWRFDLVAGTAAVISLLHDALAVISFASIFHVEISTAFIAALLTILGYSINDTIVVFDRIREDKKLLSKKRLPLIQIVNLAINQTLGRTFNTSGTTLVVILSLILFGGSTIQAFCMVLFVGIIIGTYSSIFIASPVLVVMQPTGHPEK